MFLGDSKGAVVFAVDTTDKAPVERSAAIEVKGIDQKIANLFGTKTENITITVMVVNPSSKKVYKEVKTKRPEGISQIPLEIKRSAIKLTFSDP